MKHAKDSIPLPQDIFDGSWKHTVNAAFKVAGIEHECLTRWCSNFRRWLIDDGVFDETSKTGRTGKYFDDSVDSVLSLSAAVAFALGKAHVHQGSDTDDGHIIGPGQDGYSRDCQVATT